MAKNLQVGLLAPSNSWDNIKFHSTFLYLEKHLLEFFVCKALKIILYWFEPEWKKNSGAEIDLLSIGYLEMLIHVRI